MLKLFSLHYMAGGYRQLLERGPSRAIMRGVIPHHDEPPVCFSLFRIVLPESPVKLSAGVTGCRCCCAPGGPLPGCQSCWDACKAEVAGGGHSRN